MINSVCELKGELLIEKVLDDGSREVLVHKKNLVVTTGKAMAAARLVGTSLAALAAIAVGAGSTAPAITDTILGSLLVNKAFDSAATLSANTATMTATFAAGVATGTWTEAGLFNTTATTPTAGTMFSRTTFTAIPKGASDTIAVTWNVTAN
jgi:hypothetical protein